MVIKFEYHMVLRIVNCWYVQQKAKEVAPSCFVYSICKILGTQVVGIVLSYFQYSQKPVKGEFHH